MTQQDKEQLKLEVDHIFESGANEIRIFEMVVNFIDSRNAANKNLHLIDVSDSSVCMRNLMAASQNLIGVIKSKQWERIDSKALDLENAVDIFKKNTPFKNIKTNTMTKEEILNKNIPMRYLEVDNVPNILHAMEEYKQQELNNIDFYDKNIKELTDQYFDTNLTQNQIDNLKFIFKNNIKRKI